MTTNPTPSFASAGDGVRRCAVVVAAYRATPEWIAECVRSIQAQRALPGWAFDLRIGADGCATTSRLLSELQVPHYVSAENVGPYVMRNALIAVAPADAVATFDADDVMEPSYLATLLPLAGTDGIAGGARQHMAADGVLAPDLFGYKNGVAVFSAAALRRLGAFRPWRIAADADAIRRARALKIPIRKTAERLYRRRVHANSLTRHAETGFSSTMRRNIVRESKRLTRAGDLYVSPVLTPLSLVA